MAGAQRRRDSCAGAWPGRALVVAYLEADFKSQPAWRKHHEDGHTSQIVATAKRMFAAHRVQLAPTTHSGDGSFVLGCLNAAKEIPDGVQ